jgi:hypothetical protein
MQVSKAFEVFAKEAPEYQGIWMETVQKLDMVCVISALPELNATQAGYSLYHKMGFVPHESKCVPMRYRINSNNI